MWASDEWPDGEELSEADMADRRVGDTIGAAEAEAWLGAVGVPLMAADGDPAAERRIVAEGVVRWGDRLNSFFGYLAEQAPGDPRFARWQDLARELFADFALGKRITDRFDEDERRVRLALDRFDDPGLHPLFRRMLAQHMLALPRGHPLRDVARAARVLDEVRSAYRTAQDREGELATLALVIEHELVADDELLPLIDRGEELLRDEPGARYGRRFLLAVTGLAAARAIAARDSGDRDQRQRWATRHLEVTERLRAAEPGDRSLHLQLGLSYELLDRLGEAASVFEAAAEGLGKSGRTLAMRNAGRLWANAGEWRRAVVALRSVLDDLVAQAVTDLRWDGEGDDGEFARLGLQLAWAHAKLDEWGEAVDALDRLRSPRFRARRSWRDSTAGRELLDLERSLWADQRGVPVPGPERPFDVLGDVAPRTALLEAYRQVRTELDESVAATPSPADVRAVLRPGEVLLTLGVTGRGTFAAALAGPTGSTDGAPGWRGRRDETWPLGRWKELFAGSEVGFVYAVGAPELGLDGSRALNHLLGGFEDFLTGAVGELLPADAERVTVVAHGLLHLVPFWAAPRLAECRVRTAPSIAQLVAARRRPVRALTGRAVICADPTGDLPGTRLEASVARTHLERLGLRTGLISGPDATEDRVGAAVNGAALFHFCGHGVGDVLDPAKAALLMAPDPGLVGDTDPFAALVAQVDEAAWRPSATDQDTRSTATPAGRLTERSARAGRWVERWLEAGPTTTLWAHYLDGRLTRLAERWSAGDLLVDHRFEGCRLAVLSACSSAVGSLSLDVDECSGLPAALDLAGVDVVVATTWPVADGLALLFTDMFYEALTEAEGRVDVADLVDSLRRTMRRLPLSQALDWLDGLRQRADTPWVRLSLEAYARRLRADGRPSPFSEAWEWASFGVFGGDAVEVGGSS
ncbi:CHAT domain-containing protein [Actinosynnema sp. CA-248983]